MKLIQCLLICLLLQGAGITTSRANSHTVYYTRLVFVETPLSLFKGSMPISQKVAMTRNHYRFTYDSLNRLVSVSFYNGKTPRESNETGNRFFLSSVVKISYSKNREVLLFFDRHGNPVNILGGVAQFVFELDEKGFRKELYFLNSKLQKIENSWKIYRYTWKTDTTNAIIEERYNEKGELASLMPGFDFFRTRLVFNQKGDIALMQNVDANGNLVENKTGAAQDLIDMDANGNFLGWTVLNKNHQPEKGNGPNVARGLQQFDEKGNEISLRYEDEKGNPIFSNYGFCQSVSAFDRFGNMIYRQFLDESGKPAPHQQAGYTSMKITWDKTGNNRLRMSYFDNAGHPINHTQRGFASSVNEYDKNGNLVKLTYYDAAGKIVNRTDNGIAYHVYEYDKKNKLVKRKDYDKDTQLKNP